jgi:hypothetical protein
MLKYLGLALLRAVWLQISALLVKDVGAGFDMEIQTDTISQIAPQNLTVRFLGNLAITFNLNLRLGFHVQAHRPVVCQLHRA